LGAPAIQKTHCGNWRAFFVGPEGVVDMSNVAGLRLSSFFSDKHVICHMEGADRDTCLRRLVDLLAAEGRIKNATETMKAVLVREQILSTVLTAGLAIPHARLDDIDNLLLAVATSEKGVDFGAPPGNPTRVVVLILTPVREPGLYLQALASIATLFAKEDVVERVARLANPHDVWQFFDKGASTLPKYATARDIMATDFHYLRTIDYLERAIDLFCYHHLYDIPVVDGDGDLVGVMHEEKLLGLALPDYILWLQDLSPILQLEPFVEILKNEKTLRVAEVMSGEVVTVPEDAPAIQVARIIMRREVRAVMVTRGKKVVGVITLSDFLARVLRK